MDNNKQTNPRHNLEIEKYTPHSKMIITDPEVVKCFIHEKQVKILETLLDESKTIMELSTELEWNPGTVKRHLEALIDAQLVTISHKIKNKFNITMKYYRATANYYTFEWSWPE